MTDLHAERFEVAESVNAAVMRTPALPVEVPGQGAEPVFVTERIRELLNIWHRHGIDVTGVYVRADRELLDAVEGIDAVDGVSVIFDNDVDQDTARGGFICEPQGRSPLVTFLRPALGLAFEGPVDPAVFETRWVLQEHDRLAPDLAQDIADRI